MTMISDNALLVTRWSEGGFTDYLNDDVPTVVRDLSNGFAALLDLDTRKVVGYRVYDRNPPSGEAGEADGCGHCAKCGLDWDAPATAPRCDECPPAAVEPRKRAEALTEEILKIMRGARAYLPVYSKEAIVELLVGALPTIKEPTDEVSDFIAAAKLLEDAGWKITRPESQEPTDGK
jgi:hypothetical protein